MASNRFCRLERRTVELLQSGHRRTNLQRNFIATQSKVIHQPLAVKREDASMIQLYGPCNLPRTGICCGHRPFPSFMDRPTATSAPSAIVAGGSHGP